MKLKLNNISNTILFICLTLVLSLSVLPYSVKAADIVTVSYEVTYHQSEARQMLNLINEFRTSGTWYWNADNVSRTTIAAGERTPLQLDAKLERAAMKRAAEIALFFQHTRPDETSCFSTFPEQCNVGENIAYGQGSTDEVFVAWREDNKNYEGQGHRRNMLVNGFTSIGIGCAEVNGIKYWAQAFGNTSVEQPESADDSKKIVNVDVKEKFIADAGIELETDKDYDDKVVITSYKENTIKLKVGQILKIKKVVPYIKPIITQNMIPLSGVNIKGKSLNSDIVSLDEGGSIIPKAEGRGQIVYEVNYPMGLSERRLNVEVERIDISKDEGIDIDIDTLSYGQYTGKPIEPIIKIEYTDELYKSVELEKNKDYKIEFKNNINASTGNNEAVAIITGINGYKGKKELSFLIPPADADEFRIPKIPNQKYTGKAICPKVDIKNDDGMGLVEGKDYILSYEDNVEEGTATVHVEYRGNYSGSNDVYFLIVGEKGNAVKNNTKTGPDKKEGKKEKNKDKSNSTIKTPVKPDKKIKSPDETMNSKTGDTSQHKTAIDKTTVNTKYRLVSSSGTVILSLKQKKGVTYKIQYSTEKDMKKSAIINLKKAKTTSDKLKKGKTYYIKVGEVKNGKIKWGKIKKLIIK